MKPNIFVLFSIVLLSNKLKAEIDNSVENKKKQIKDEVKDERVIGGREAFLGECPYQVALLANKRFICGGFFIQGNAVVTAAHCVYG